MKTVWFRKDCVRLIRECSFRWLRDVKSSVCNGNSVNDTYSSVMEDSYMVYSIPLQGGGCHSVLFCGTDIGNQSPQLHIITYLSHTSHFYLIHWFCNKPSTAYNWKIDPTNNLEITASDTIVSLVSWVK